MMGEPFTFKDMETTSDMARGLIQFIERSVTKLSDDVFNAINDLKNGKDSELAHSYGTWDRFVTAFMADEDVISDFNRLVTIANEKSIDLNQDTYFLQKFLRYLRPQFEKRKREMAQIVNLGGMANLKPFEKRAETRVKKLQIKGAYPND